ncbi:MAG: hypothetical protein IT203_12005 [Fimbriimonadaceae bacterium]|nr:hypothetical protein [Fimbriimonadaceae bacterium]
MPRLHQGSASSGVDRIERIIDQPEGLTGKAALFHCQAETGIVLMFSMNPTWRMQTASNYELLFNAVRNWDKLTSTGTNPN